jgi:hypothetical protein
LDIEKLFPGKEQSRSKAALASFPNRQPKAGQIQRGIAPGHESAIR